ncbi:MAG TPA: TMEM14 family protein [Chthoniobacter sp.]
MRFATEIFYYVFGLITLIGGIQAFIGVKSKASLIAGGISGLLLLAAGFMAMGTLGPILGLIVCLALSGRFLPKFFKEKKWWPAGVEGWLGLVGVVLSVIALVLK